MAHTVVGYPSLEENWAMLEAMQHAGVDLVELQLPFSEPIADGPVFVRANQSAIDAHLDWKTYFDFFTRASQTFDFDLIFMGYYNPIFRMGAETFVERLATAGGCGYIVADLPPEEATEVNTCARARGLDPVLLMTPTNSEDRLRQIAAQASGLLYCVARKGVTGKHTQLSAGVGEFLGRCRQTTDLPLALGFGIKNPEDVRAVQGLADVAIVGTACLEAWETLGPKGYSDFLKALVNATR